MPHNDGAFFGAGLDDDGFFPSMLSPDTYPREEGEGGLRRPGTVTMESKEFGRMLEVVAAAHAFLIDGKPLAALERAYGAYSRMCGVPVAEGGEHAAGEKTAARSGASPAKGAFPEFCRK